MEFNMPDNEVEEDLSLVAVLSNGTYYDYSSVNEFEQRSNEKDIVGIKFYLILSCLFMNVFVAALDSTIVATLLPVIASDLDCLPLVSWVATSYLLSCAAFQPVFGRFSEIFGRKSVTMFCCIIFGIGCLCCGICKTLPLLIFGRAISGIGGGGFNTMSAIILSDIVPLKQRGLYQGYVNIFFGLGSGLGGLFAGIFQKHFNWRVAFLSQIPMCVISCIITYFSLDIKKENYENSEITIKDKIKQVNFFGSGLLIGSIFILMLAASIGGKEVAYNSILFIMMVLFGSCGILGFYIYELKLQSPVIPVSLLNHKTVLWSSLGCWVLSMNTFCILLYVPFYWESVFNISSYDSGLRLIPGAVTATTSSILVGLYIKIFKRYRVILIWCSLINLLGSYLVFISSSENASYWYQSLILIPCNFGMASLVTIYLISMISSVAKSEQGLVTSIQYGFRSTGSTLGVSLANAILQSSLTRNLISNFKNVQKDSSLIDAVIKKAILDVNYAHTKAPSFAKPLIIKAYSSACHDIFSFILITGIFVTLCSIFIGENDL